MRLVSKIKSSLRRRSLSFFSTADVDVDLARLQWGCSLLLSVLIGFDFCFVASYAESFRLVDGCAFGNVLYGLESGLSARTDGRINSIYQLRV